MEYAGALNPSSWSPAGFRGMSRAYPVESSAHGKTVNLILRRVRSPDDPVAVSFSDSFPAPDASRNLRKALFIHKNLRFEDDSVVVRAEKPLGLVRMPDGSELEAYLMEEGAVKRGQMGGRGREDAEKAIKKYLKVKRNLRGFMYLDSDMNELDDNLLFSRDERGRTVLTKIDSEYTRVVDLGNLRVRAESVDSMLESAGFSPRGFEGVGFYRSVVGHAVAERLLDACALMDGVQERVFLSPENAGALVKSAEGYALKAGGDPRAEFMSTLSTVLSVCSEIVPAQRAGYVRAMAGLLDRWVGRRQRDLVESGRVEAGFAKIKPSLGEKDGLLWR